jgi:hypothetical protein
MQKMNRNKIILVISAAFQILGCSDPRSLYVSGTILGFKPENRFAYSIKIGNAGGWNGIKNIESDGTYRISVSLAKRDLNDSVYLLLNGKAINIYIVERNISYGDGIGKLYLIDTVNGIRYSIEDNGPLHIQNLLLCGKIETRTEN